MQAGRDSEPQSKEALPNGSRLGGGFFILGFILALDVPAQRGGGGSIPGLSLGGGGGPAGCPHCGQRRPSHVPPLETSARPLPPGQQRVKSFCFGGNTVYIMSMNKRWLC